MAGSTRIVVALYAVLLAGCARGPQTFQDGMRLGAAALRDGDLERAEKMYTATFEMADEAGNESFSVFAADYAADAALARKAPERALRLYERMVARYPEAVRINIGRFRIPNNLAVLLARAGREQESIPILERALADFDGRGISPAFPFPPRAVLTRNLVRIHARHAWDGRSEAVLQSAATRLEAEVDRDPGGDFTSGAHALFEALGDFVSRGPRPDEAAHFYARAQEAAARERSRPGFHGDLQNRLCEPRAIDGVTAEGCYEIL
jgi:tetratricopeptide (TPR) repeat protein